ncbi:MAG: stage V sporulation protein AB [Lachnospiraceae bacterium]
MWMKEAGLCALGLSFGLFVSGGVFTTLTAVGLVPRFAGKTHTADKAFLYEEMVVLGTLFGNLTSIFYERICLFLSQLREKSAVLWESSGRLWPEWLGKGMLSFYGLFTGIFVGCLALAIAELLDTIPIFARRTNLTLGIKAIILGMAFGKLFGSLFDACLL